MKKQIKSPISKGVAKVPVIMQMEALECGAACLTMIMAYYEKWIPLEQVRKDCGVSRDGSKAKNILIAARNYGFEASGYKVELSSLKNSISFPCIIHWEFNHFIVLTGIKGNSYYINDPARGNIRLTEEEFDEGFTGVVLLFKPTESFVPSGKKQSVFSYAVSRLKDSGSAFAFVIITTLITSLINVINPVFSRIFIDRLLTGINPNWYYPFIAALTFLMVLQLTASAIQAIYSKRINGKMAAVGNSTYIWKILHLPMDFFSQRMSGDIMNRQSANATICTLLIDTLAPLAINAMVMVFYLIVMIRYSPMLTVIGLVSVLMNLGMSNLIAKKRINITRVLMRDRGKLESATISGIEMIETIKASGAEEGYFTRWSGFHASVNTQNVKFMQLNEHLGLIPTTIKMLSENIILLLSIYLTIKGEFTLGMVTAFQGFLLSFLGPAETLISAGTDIQEMTTDMERIEDVMSYPEDNTFLQPSESADDDTHFTAKLSGNISLKNITFGYSRLERPLIENLSLDIKPGQQIAIVGLSGCGKSTISKLISGLYSPWSGEILFDGIPLNQIPKHIFKSSIASVDQDIILFEDTISNNIKMWDNSIESFEVILAARDANIHNDIVLRGGYNKTLLEGGKDFSGGQRQRMEIARVLAQDPTIIIMDEATSALDARTEYNVVNAIRDRGITCIVVAHRLSTIKDSNLILVMDKGKIVEQGTHSELFSLGGRYKELVTNE